MLPFPVPSFEHQRLEIEQRYRIISPDGAAQAHDLASLACRSLGVTAAYASVTERHREAFTAHSGLGALPAGIAAHVPTLCMRAALSDEAFFVPDASMEGCLAGHGAVAGPGGISFFAGAPIQGADGARLGTFCVMDPRPRVMTPGEEGLLHGFAGLAARALSLGSAARYAVRDLIEAERKARLYYDLAMTDPLTGALNRRAFAEVAARELARSRRHDRPLSVLMVDLDRFKAVNDRHGHEVGDHVLRGTSAAVLGAVRDEDALGRLGGEEFALILPETPPDQAVGLADRLRGLIAGLAFRGKDGGFRVTASFGVSAPGDQETTIAPALRRADEALYAAKSAGRNRTVSLAA